MTLLENVVEMWVFEGATLNVAGVILNCSEDMQKEQKDRYIDYLAERVANLDLDKRAMELVLEDLLKTQQEMQETLETLQKEQEKLLKEQDELLKEQDELLTCLEEETCKRMAAEREVQRLNERLTQIGY